jgi:hypothetical protein
MGGRLGSWRPAPAYRVLEAIEAHSLGVGISGLIRTGNLEHLEHLFGAAKNPPVHPWSGLCE